MKKPAMTSKERLLKTMGYEETDYVPCSFMMFHGLRDRFPGDQIRFVEEQTKLGLDAVVELPELPMEFHPDVTWRNWVERNVPGESFPLIHKQYVTPAGSLHTVVRQTEDWPDGDEIRFYSDFNVPRSKRFHINGREDLNSLRYLLMPPSAEQVRQYRSQCAVLKEYAAKNGLLVRGVRGVLIDAVIRFAGTESLIYAAVDDPEYFEELLEIVWNWNMARMEIVLDERPDLFLRRAWYENTSFWSRDLFRRFMMPYIQKEVKWTHEAGARYGYINTVAYMSLLEDFMETGFDVLIGADPAEDKQLDMAKLKGRALGHFSLWGGCSGFVTVEEGTEDDVRAEVNHAMDILAPGGGFILSPVDNVRSMSDKAMTNSRVLIDEWKKRR